MDNQKLFQDTIKEIEIQFGKGSITNIDDVNHNIDVIKTGSVNLDNALGINGYPKGRVTEIFGTESSGKTTLALQAIKQCQLANGRAVYIDVENALDQNYCKANGIDLKKLLIAKPENGEQTFAIIDALVKTKMIDLIIVDSVAALVPEAEMNGEYSDQQIGLHARLMSKGLRILQNIISKYNVAIIFINQIREKVGTFFHDSKTTTGGWALRFFSSIRIELKKVDLLKNGSEIIGIKTRAKIVKNKLAPPMTNTLIDIYFDKGFDYHSEVISKAIEKGIITKKGSWFYYQEQKLAQGKEGIKILLKDPKNKDLFIKIEKLSLKKEIIK